ncbi:MAG: hypothetical protein E6G20_09755 [Actinobacteria bacterium]|nr:MAG: hypothetical protein E6G20_09755 [Actinomycetota bacterium]
MLWIVIFAVLLSGVVAVNVAVLRLNLQLDRVSSDRTQLKADINELRRRPISVSCRRTRARPTSSGYRRSERTLACGSRRGGNHVPPARPPSS